MAVDFLDELASGVPFVAAPDVQHAFGVSYGVTTLGLFVLPTLAALLFEPPLFILSDRFPKKAFVCGGLALMGVSSIVAGLATSFAVLTIAIAGLYVGTGLGVSLAQACLSDADPEGRERMLTRWTILGILGDVAAPVLVSAIAFFGGGFRAGFVVAGLVALAYAAILSFQRFPSAPELPDTESSEPALGFRDALRRVLRDRIVLAWLCADWLTNLLDELLVVLAALHLRDHLDASAFERGVVLACLPAGALVGLLVVERLLRWHPPMRLLALSAAATSVVYPLFIVAPNVPLSAALFFLVGCFSGPLYPLSRAQAYRALPSRSGMLQALAHVFTPLDLVLPLALGLVADQFGTGAALAVLIIQPLGILAITRFTRLRRQGPG